MDRRDFSLDNETIESLLDILELGEMSDNARIICRTLLAGGRQSLVRFRSKILPKIFHDQVEKENSDLLTELKHYFKQLWSLMPDQWFQIFLKENVKKYHENYEKVLTRAAEKGPSLGVMNPAFGLILQIVFYVDESFLNNDNLHEEMFECLLENGWHDLKKYAKNNVDEEFETHEGFLFAAIRENFSDDLRKYFESVGFSILEAEKFDIIVDSVVLYGLVDGLCRPEVRNHICDEDFEKLNLSAKLEGKLIKSCMGNEGKWQLNDLVQAGEFCYVEKSLADAMDEIIKQDFPSMINQLLIPVVYLLKRHQNLDMFRIDLNSKLFDRSTPSENEMELSLRFLIHILLLKSDRSVSRKIMYLLSRTNPVPLLEPSFDSGDETTKLVPEIYHVWNNSLFTLLSFGLGECIGKSSLLNQIFFSSFEQRNSTSYFKKTIDVDFGWNFFPSRPMNVADAHGSMDEILFKRIRKLFDGFLLHVRFSDLSTRLDEIKRYITFIEDENKFLFLIVRDVEKRQEKNCDELLQTHFSTINKFRLPDVKSPDDTTNRNFIIRLTNEIYKKAPGKPLADAKQSLVELMNSEDRNYIERITQLISGLEGKLDSIGSNPDLVDSYLPQYSDFVKICGWKSKLTRDNFYANENHGEVEELREKIIELQKKMKINTTTTNDIDILFRTILNDTEMIPGLEYLLDNLREKGKNEQTFFVEISES